MVVVLPCLTSLHFYTSNSFSSIFSTSCYFHYLYLFYQGKLISEFVKAPLELRSKILFYDITLCTVLSKTTMLIKANQLCIGWILIGNAFVLLITCL